MARQTSPAPVLPRRRLLHHRMTGGWGWRAALVPTPPAETHAGGTQRRRRRWEGKKKRAPGSPGKSGDPLSPLRALGSRRTPSFKRGSPPPWAAPSPQRPRHTRYPELGWAPVALPADGGGPVSAGGSARLAHAAAAAAGQRSSGRSPPAALNYSWGVYYIRSHKLEPLCNAIRERYARPLLLLSGSRSL